VEESELTGEHLALIGFAARLGTSISNDSHLVEDSEVRKEAELLMSLLSSTPTTKSLFCEEKESKSEENGATAYASHSSSYRKKTFSFCCPSLSLKPSYGTAKSNGLTPCPINARKISDSDESSASLTASVNDALTPADLFGRPLKVDDRDALRLSAEAMARNTLQSYEKAVAWRIQTWVNAVARVLVSKEKAILGDQVVESKNKNEETEQALKGLLGTPEASLIKSLQLVATEIEVIDAKTSFRVLPQKLVQKSTGNQPPKKKFRSEQQSEYSVKHVLSFQTVLNLNTPAGYTEVTLQAPGTIEGTFKNGVDGEETLEGINIEVDTKVLANTIERSTRIVVRCASEVCIQPIESEEEELKATSEDVQVQEESAPTPIATAVPIKNSNAAIVTPRYNTPYSSKNDIKLEDTAGTTVPFPNLDGLDKHNPLIPMRMVSPQPNSPDMVPVLLSPRSASSSPTFTKNSHPHTPTLTKAKTPKVPLLITPNPISRNVTYEGFSSPSPEVLGSPGTETKKILPALVEVACAAMHAPN